MLFVTTTAFVVVLAGMFVTTVQLPRFKFVRPSTA
jgi:hypothetical protein